MLRNNQLIGFGSSNNLISATHFNGSGDIIPPYLYKTSAFSGASNSGKFTMSCWVNITLNQGAELFQWRDPGDSVSNIRLNFNAATTQVLIDLFINPAASTRWLAFNSSLTPFSGAWTNVLFSVDMEHSSGARLYSLYIGGTAITLTINTDIGGSMVFDYSSMTYNGIAAIYNGTPNSPGQLMSGDLAEFWYAAGVYTDFSNSNNRAKFSKNGLPTYLGSDGSLPFGSQPTIYLRNPSSSFNIDSGSGGDFIVNGVLTPAATSPGPYG